MRLVTAEGAVLNAILDGTYPIWGEGLSREAYEKWNRAQLETPWGGAHLRRVALVDGDRLLASAKRYDLEAWMAGGRRAVLGIGAVFTPAPCRRQGHARTLLEMLIEDAVRLGCGTALLFSEIGAAYYERLGFRARRQQVSTIEIVSRPGAPAAHVRFGHERDLPAIAEIAMRAREGASFALDRAPDQIAFNLTRKRLLAGLGPPGLRSVEFLVTEEGHRAVAYIVLTRGPHGAFLEDCGDRDPSGARVGAMLQAIAARAPADAPLRFRAWRPQGFLPPQWRVVSVADADEIMMLRNAAEDVTIAAGPTIYPHLDVF